MSALHYAPGSTQQAKTAWPVRPQVHARALTILTLAAPVLAPIEQKAPSADHFGDDLARAMFQLRRYALWLAKSPALADDLMQDALLNAWRAQDRFEPGTNLNAWCRAILRNVHVSYMRRSWRVLPMPDEMIEAIPASGHDSSVALDLLAVRNAIRLLPTEQREALLLVGAGGMSYQQAAETCGCAVGTMKSRVSRARVRLGELIASNQVGYNSDGTIRAADALGDLMHQVAGIQFRAGMAACSRADGVSVSAVLSEAQPAAALVVPEG